MVYRTLESIQHGTIIFYMKLTRKVKKRLVLLGAVAASILVILIIVNSILAYFSRPRLISYLKESVHEASDSLYTLEFDKIGLDLVRGRVHISDLYLRPDTQLYESFRRQGKGPPILYEVHSDHFDVRGVNLFKLWRSKKLEIDLISIENPEIWLLKQVLPEDTVAKPFSFDPYKMISPMLTSLEVEAIRVADGKLSYNKQGGDKNLSLLFNRFYLETDGLYIDSLSSRDTAHAFYADDLRLSINNFKFQLPDSLYNIHFGAIGFSSKESTLTIESLYLEPRHGEMEFHKIVGKETDHIQLKIGSIVAEDFDMRSFLRNEDLIAGQVTIERASLIDFLYNFKVDDRPYQQLPHLVLKNAGMPIDIRKLIIKNSEAIYKERLAGHSETGGISFKNLNGVITNISNVPERIEEDSVIHAEVTTSLMDMGELKVDFNFHLDRNDGYFTVNGALGRMPLEAVNPMVEATARIKIKRGTLQKLLFSFAADSTRSRGTMKFYYNNLNVELLGKENSESNMKIASALTNLLLLNSDNPPPEGPLRTGAISFKRLKNKSIFNYLWKSLLTGFKASVGVTAQKEADLRNMAEMFKERKQRREQRREKRQERRAERRNN